MPPGAIGRLHELATGLPLFQGRDELLQEVVFLYHPAPPAGSADRSSDFQLYLLGRIVLEADSRNEVELRLQPLDVLLAFNDQMLEELPRAGIVLLQTEGNPLIERGQGTRFQCRSLASRSLRS